MYNPSRATRHLHRLRSGVEPDLSLGASEVSVSFARTVTELNRLHQVESGCLAVYFLTEMMFVDLAVLIRPRQLEGYPSRSQSVSSGLLAIRLVIDGVRFACRFHPKARRPCSQ